MILLAEHSVALRLINNLRIMLNYSLDFNMSSLIAICTINCLYKLFVQIDIDPTNTSWLYARESVTYRLAHLHLNRKFFWVKQYVISWEHGVLTKCLTRTFWSPNIDFVLMRVNVQTTSIKCSQMWLNVRGPYE